VTNHTKESVAANCVGLKKMKNLVEAGLSGLRNEKDRSTVMLTSAAVFVVLKTKLTVKEFTETAVPTH
jgi:hypothetical protein